MREINHILLLAVLIFFSSFKCSANDLNIILIVVDDLGYADLSCYANTKDVSTPNIDKLAKTGIRFTNAYVTAPICNASRISIATGTYQQRQGVYWYEGLGLEKKEFLTIAECLKADNYTNGYIGKVHHGTNDVPAKRGFPLNHGFDTFFGFTGGTKHYLHHDQKYVDEKDYLSAGPMYQQEKLVDVEGFSTELFGAKAREFIEVNKNKKFFLQLSFNAIHNYTHQLPESYLKEKSLKGFEDLKKDENYWEWRKKISFPAHPEGRDYYLGQLYFLDREIGLLIEKLKDLRLREKTAIIFLSDNGGSLVTYANNGELAGGKYTLFEGGIRVPMIISLPNYFAEGENSDSLISSMDILPTICSLAKVTIPPKVDGVDLINHLKTKTPLTREMLFFDTQHQVAVRHRKWKYLETKSTPNERLQITPTPKGIYLYDLEQDPGEKTNVADKYPEVVSQLTKELQKWQKEIH